MLRRLEAEADLMFRELVAELQKWMAPASYGSV
jgi:hypothetical protein